MRLLHPGPFVTLISKCDPGMNWGRLKTSRLVFRLHPGLVFRYLYFQYVILALRRAPLLPKCQKTDGGDYEAQTDKERCCQLKDIRLFTRPLFMRHLS